jgi:hypothetical protein
MIFPISSHSDQFLFPRTASLLTKKHTFNVTVSNLTQTDLQANLALFKTV